MDEAIEAAVRDPRRLAALRQTGLLDSEAEAAFDRLTRLAARVLRAPVALVSLVDGDRQFFKSSVGLPEPWRSLPRDAADALLLQARRRLRPAPCRRRRPRDTRSSATTRRSRELGVVAYLGIPLAWPPGDVLGSFCVIDTSPRVLVPRRGRRPRATWPRR